MSIFAVNYLCREILRDHAFRAAMKADPAKALAPLDLTDHLALVARWFYSKPREGEMLFRDKVWPYRRMLRACSRLLAGPQQPQSAPHPQQ